MRTLLSLLLGAVLLSSAAYGQSPSIYLMAPGCLNDASNPLRLILPGFQPLAIEIQAFAPLGAQAFEFSIPGFTSQAGILVTDLVPNPEAAFADGDPFAAGARIVFTTCQSEPVTLYTATLFVLGNGISVDWTVAPHSTGGPGTTCPTASPCGGGSASCVYAGLPRTPAIAPYYPSPADGATGVPLHPSLFAAWSTGTCTCLGVPCTALYLGVDPDPPLFFAQCDMPWPELDLTPSTTYYWRVSVDFCGSVIGPVWSFTTEPPISVEGDTWSNVKRVFR